MLAKMDVTVYNAMEMSDTMQKCRLNMIKQSLLEDESKECESYIADVIETNGRMSFRYQEADGAKVRIVTDADGVEILRQGEVKSSIRLRLGQIQKVVIDSPYGQMAMESYTINIIRSLHYLVVEYELMQEKQIVGHFRITWQLMKEDVS